MSYNNYVDADAARRAAFDHDGPAVAVVKHNNPCGVATADDIADAYRKAHATDPVSAYGGVVASNRVVTTELAEALKPVFTEVIVAPGYEDGALEVLATKKNLRVLVLPTDVREDPIEFRAISGGVLVQTVDKVDAVVRDADGQVTGGDDPQSWRLVAGDAADEATLADLAFAWTSIRAVKSNAILLADQQAAVGIGMGQVNRVDSCKLAVERANTLGEGEERARGSVAASDAFFPFADGLQILLDAGVRAVVAPGGSIRDDEVIAAAQEAGVTMYFTGTRHFAH
jgi:phosphoribosylaminoimidazolecarboxamide formyltransferase/IMP cyclohydrolase